MAQCVQNEEIDESEFYHQDFTTASDWEVFIAQIEEIISEWRNEDNKANQISESSKKWLIRTENLVFVDFEFTLSLHRKYPCGNNAESPEDENKNPFNSFYDFELYDPGNDKEHLCISKWYGIDEFIVLSPKGNIGITSETRIKILLSSLYIVSSNTKCAIPLFVQIREKWQHCYLGVYEKNEIRTNLEMIHLKTIPKSCQYLSGLLELFKSKIVSPIMMSTIIVSLQSNYILDHFGSVNWKQDYQNPENFNPAHLSVLPFGVTVDPIEAVILKTSWHLLNHRAVRDTETYSDFDPMRADKWSCLVKTTDKFVCLLGDSLADFLYLVNNYATLNDVLGEFATVENQDAANALNLLTEPKIPTISYLISRAARHSLRITKTTAPIPEDILVSMLYYLFPDADKESKHIYKDDTNQPIGNADFSLEHECRGFKTCGVDSLIWRLSILMAHCLQSFGGIRAFFYLWFEFIQELRYRLDKSIKVPGILPGYPDLRTSLIHQKLQMLNCCIERKQLRESSTQHFDSAENSSTDDEEFFDCADKPHEDSKKRTSYSLWNQPTGRLTKFNNLKLIQTGDPLYIPVTQEPVPKCEDQLEEDTDVLLKLGTNAEGSELRAKMMSASLLSDMESFKAANPGSILDDFIRWYSPRDFIEDEEELDEWGQKRGELSSRMKLENNFWIQTWNSAKPVPAHRQKRLFDDTCEAEKVLHYLESRNLSQIVEMLLPTLYHAAIYKLYDEIQQISVGFPDFNKKLNALIKTVERSTRDTKFSYRRYETLIQEITALELEISQANSILYKLNPNTDAIDIDLCRAITCLICGQEIDIFNKADSKIGGRIVAMFSEAQKLNAISELTTEDETNIYRNSVFPQPIEREIVLRVSVPKPASYSSDCPQFLRAVIGRNEFRLVGAFSEDVIFF